MKDYSQLVNFINDNDLGKLDEDLNFAGSFESEYCALYSGVGLRIFSDQVILQLSGNDVIDFLHRITTNNIKNIQSKELVDTIFTTEKGRIIDKVKVLNFDNHQYLLLSYECLQRIKIWLEKYIISDDVKIISKEDQYSVMEVLGPQADSFLLLICGPVMNGLQDNFIKAISTDEGLSFFIVKTKDQNKKDKYIIISEHEVSKKLIKEMYENNKIFDFKLLGRKSYDTYRIEQGIPEAPNELNDLYNPNEANLLNLVCFTKGCYIGQEVISRLDTYEKVQKKLSGIVFEQDKTISGNFKIIDDVDNEAGLVTSYSYSPKLKKYVGLAYIKKEYLENEKDLYAVNNGQKVSITLTKLPIRR